MKKRIDQFTIEGFLCTRRRLTTIAVLGISALGPMAYVVWTAVNTPIA